MTDRLTISPTEPAPSRAAGITLVGWGKTWGRLLEGRYLELSRRGRVVVFDLLESERLGVAVGWEEDGD